MFFSVEDKIYALELMPEHARTSKNFDIQPVQEKPNKKYIPPMSHPWKQASFERYMKNQAHRSENVA